MADVVAATTRFGHDLAGVDRADAHGNWFASPLSIEVAFAMLRAGAGGATAAELDGAFGFPSEGLAGAFNTLTSQIGTQDVPPPAQEREQGQPPRQPVVCVGNGLFPQAGQPIGPEFLRTLAEQYGAGVYPVDFATPRALNAINQWVTERTAGRIKELFNQLPPQTRLVLANTVYLRADWRTGFEPSATVPADFTRADGTVVQVPTMHATVHTGYATGAGWQAVELPYVGDLAMRLVVPTDGSRLSPADLLAPQLAADVAAGLRQTALQVALPRVRMSHTIDLNQALPPLGVRTAFSPQADFAGIAPGLFVGQAVHRATVTMDEQGTEAAAATGISMLTSAQVPPELTVRLDRPFAFSIVHVPTGMPLFVGQVGDPSAES